MAITYTPFDELFAPAYQLTYISTDGHIDVGQYTYSVFHYYTMQERQVIFQVCEKHLPWEHTQEQEQWERTQYMYQFIIKSPPPFPYEEYPLSEEIRMFTEEEEAIMKLIAAEKRATYRLNKVNVAMGMEIRSQFALIDTQIRANYEPIIAPLQVEAEIAQNNLKAEAEK